MKNLFKLLGLSAIIVIVLAGCGPTAHIETSDNADFGQYSSFAWAQKSERGSRAGLMEQKIKDAISFELERSKGWKETDRNPDVLLSYDVLMERGSRLQSDPMYSWGGYRTFYNPYQRRFYNVYYPSMFMGYDNYQVPTREGTITITMVDAKTDQTILQGWATDEINGQKISSNEVNRIVASIFKKWDGSNRNQRGYANMGNNRYEKHYPAER